MYQTKSSDHLFQNVPNNVIIYSRMYPTKSSFIPDCTQQSHLFQNVPNKVIIYSRMYLTKSSFIPECTKQSHHLLKLLQIHHSINNTFAVRLNYPVYSLKKEEFHLVTNPRESRNHPAYWS